MTELETTGGSDGPQGPDFDPPRGDEGLDDWFARRLEAQGIVASRPGFPTARIMAVLGLLAALVAMGWVISGTGGSSTAATPTSSTGTSGTQPTSGGGKNGGSKKHAGANAVDWRTIKITVLNGFGGTGAASTTQTQLEAQGWNIVAAANAGTTSVTTTKVVYVPGKKAEAKVVAQRLHLPPPVPIAEAGVQPALTNGVAILLGADGLPAVVPTA